MVPFSKLFSEAAKHIGKREKPSGSNLTEFSREFGRIPGYPSGGFGYPWCQAFQSVIADRAGLKANTDYPKTASCTAAAQWFRRHGRLHSTPKVGDQILYTRDGGSTFYHVGLVVAIDGNTMTTIEGNTSGTFKGNYWNGDGVYKKTQRIGSRSARYGRVQYASEPKPSKPKAPVKLTRVIKMGDHGNDVAALKNRLIALGGPHRVKPGPNYGKYAKEAVEAFQASHGLSVDGEVGNDTWGALFDVS